MMRWRRAMLLACLLAPAAQAQFSLYQVSGSEEVPVGALFSFGSVDPNQPVAATFFLVNTTSQTQTVALFSVSGVGFSTNAAAPMSLKAGASVKFTITFEGAAAGAYSGSLDATGISVLLTANVAPALTYEVQQSSGASPLGATPVNFGSVQVGSSATLSFLAVNQTTMALPVGAISVSAGDFALVGPSPGGTTLDPQASAGFAIRFSPMAAGTGTGLLEIGGLQFRLTGTGSALPLPAPVLSITLGEPQSAQQGSAAVSFAAPAPSSGSGTVTLSFAAQTTGALDPGIVFADGSQTAPFTFNQGDTAAAFSGGGSIPFQTGTTAGTLTLVAQIGGTVSRQDVVIAPALVGVGAVQGTRQASAVTVNLTGFDNTRTAGRLSFTFYDAAGNTVLPGAINADGSDAFSSYFASSGDGGQFSLSAYFPVSGDPRR